MRLKIKLHFWFRFCLFYYGLVSDFGMGSLLPVRICTLLLHFIFIFISFWDSQLILLLLLVGYGYGEFVLFLIGGVWAFSSWWEGNSLGVFHALPDDMQMTI